MVSELERQAREADEPNRTAAEIARELAQKLNANVRTIKMYLHAKRTINPQTGEPFASLRELYIYRITQNTLNPDTGKLFENPSEYVEFLRQRNGSSTKEYKKNWNLSRGLKQTEYNDYLEERNDGETIDEYVARCFDEDFFAKGLQTAPNKRFRKIPAESRDFCAEREKAKYLVNMALNEADLTAREKRILQERYTEGKTLKQVGKLKDIRLSRERIRQIETGALRKMRKVVDKYL